MENFGILGIKHLSWWPFKLLLKPKICEYYDALKLKNEVTRMYWVSKKVKSPELYSPTERLSTLLLSNTNLSKHFLSNIQKYNSCFQITSFVTTNIMREKYVPTFKVQGQICHRAKSLLPLSDTDHFCRFIPWETLITKFINIAWVSNYWNHYWIIRAQNEKSSLHCKFYLINTIN